MSPKANGLAIPVQPGTPPPAKWEALLKVCSSVCFQLRHDTALLVWAPPGSCQRATGSRRFSAVCCWFLERASTPVPLKCFCLGGTLSVREVLPFGLCPENQDKDAKLKQLESALQHKEAQLNRALQLLRPQPAQARSICMGPQVCVLCVCVGGGGGIAEARMKARLRFSFLDPAGSGSAELCRSVVPGAGGWYFCSGHRPATWACAQPE